jgi:hypothetical protein
MIPKIKIKTKEERDALLSFLDVTNRRIFSRENTGTLVIGNDWNRFSWFEDVNTVFEGLKSENAGYDAYTQEIKDLTALVSRLPVIKIALPFEPTNDFVDKAYDEVSVLEPGGFILDVILDKSIIYGGKLFYRGQYVDLTLRSRINYLLSSENAVNKYL